MFKIKSAFLLAMSAVLLVSCGINKSAQTNPVKADCKEISGKTNIRIKITVNTLWKMLLLRLPNKKSISVSWKKAHTLVTTHLKKRIDMLMSK